MMIKAATIYDGVRGGMICIGHLVIDPGTIAANTNETAEVDVEGVRVGDVVLLTPPHNLAEGLVLVGATVTDEDEVSVTVGNVTAAEVTGEEQNWNAFILKRQTPGGCETEEDES